MRTRVGCAHACGVCGVCMHVGCVQGTHTHIAGGDTAPGAVAGICGVSAESDVCSAEEHPLAFGTSPSLVLRRQAVIPPSWGDDSELSGCFRLCISGLSGKRVGGFASQLCFLLVM